MEKQTITLEELKALLKKKHIKSVNFIDKKLFIKTLSFREATARFLIVKEGSVLIVEQI